MSNKYSEEDILSVIEEMRQSGMVEEVIDANGEKKFQLTEIGRKYGKELTNHLAHGPTKNSN